MNDTGGAELVPRPFPPAPHRVGGAEGVDHAQLFCGEAAVGAAGASSGTCGTRVVAIGPARAGRGHPIRARCGEGLLRGREGTGWRRQENEKALTTPCAC